MKESDRFLENGDFFRLRQAQLGYTFTTYIETQFLNIEILHERFG